MRKFIKLLMMAAPFLFLTVSCEKEGVYNPKQKINRIYHSTSVPYYTGDKFVKEIWDWDNNILRGISYYDETGDLRYTESYNYDSKKRLSEISWGGGARYALFYEGNKLSHIDYIYGSTVTEQMEFSYMANKMTEIKIIDFDYKSGVAPLSPTIFRVILPNLSEQATARILDRVNTARNSKVHYSYCLVKLEWEGVNVTKIIIEDGFDLYTVEFSYDKKQNPFKGLFDFSEFDSYEPISANNIVKEIYTEGEGNEGDIFNFTYTYDGDYPTSKTETDYYGGYTFTETDYYEYR